MRSFIQTLGKTLVKVIYKNSEYKLPLYIIDGDDIPILGLDWMSVLKVSLSFNEIPNNIFNINDSSELINKFSLLFSKELGNIKGYEAKINIQLDARPMIWKPRLVPFAMRDKVDDELNRLAKEGIIDNIDSMKERIIWESPIVCVNKKDGSLRINADFKVTINNYIDQEPYLLPIFEDLISKLNRGVRFSAIDLKEAYLQMNVSKSSQRLLTITSQNGLYRYKRLPFGISCTPAIFQRYMDNLWIGLNGVACYLEDIIITGRDNIEHIKNLEEVLKRLDVSGRTTNYDKCQFFKDEIHYLGHRIDKYGIHPSADKVSAIKNCKRPENLKELKNFWEWLVITPDLYRYSIQCALNFID